MSRPIDYERVPVGEADYSPLDYMRSFVRATLAAPITLIFVLLSNFALAWWTYGSPPAPALHLPLTSMPAQVLRAAAFLLVPTILVLFGFALAAMVSVIHADVKVGDRRSAETMVGLFLLAWGSAGVLLLDPCHILSWSYG